MLYVFFCLQSVSFFDSSAGHPTQPALINFPLSAPSLLPFAMYVMHVMYVCLYVCV